MQLYINPGDVIWAFLALSLTLILGVLYGAVNSREWRQNRQKRLNKKS